MKSKTRRLRTDQRLQEAREDQGKTIRPQMARRRKVQQRNVGNAARRKMQALTAKVRRNPTKSSKIRKKSHKSL